MSLNGTGHQSLVYIPLLLKIKTEIKEQIMTFNLKIERFQYLIQIPFSQRKGKLSAPRHQYFRGRSTDIFQAPSITE